MFRFVKFRDLLLGYSEISRFPGKKHRVFLDFEISGEKHREKSKEILLETFQKRQNFPPAAG